MTATLHPSLGPPTPPPVNRIGPVESLPDHSAPPSERAFVSWVHFGDLHITGEREQNYRDLLALVAEVNAHLAGPGGVRFVFLPGDNADNGTEAQYRLILRALDGLCLPVQALPGDHDIQGGDLRSFCRWLEPVLLRSQTFGHCRCVFLNAVDIEGTKGFDFGPLQLIYLEDELTAAARLGQRAAVFMHTYPSELAFAGPTVASLLRRHDHVRVVEMGHTHYNEVANDGRLIYAATRSTGQIEEGPVGFSVTCLDGDTVSWKFKALVDPWPLVMITSPADQAFLTSALGPVSGRVEVRARAWAGNGGVVHAACRVDDGPFYPMRRTDEAGPWRWQWDSTGFADGPHELTVRAETTLGRTGEDTITVRCNQAGRYDPLPRAEVDMENAIGAYPAKGLLGTRLGPNKNGHPWGAS